MRREYTPPNMGLDEWRQAITTPPAYKFGNSTLRFQPKYILLVFFLLVIFVLYFTLPSTRDNNDLYTLPSSSVAVASDSSTDRRLSDILSKGEVGGKKAAILFGKASEVDRNYNAIYPLTKPVSTEKGLRYNIGIVSDLDQDSKTSSGKWISYLRRGSLYVQWNSETPKLSKVSIEWDNGEPQTVKSGYSLDGRGMEFSELVVFNGKLYTCDDRTGIIFEIPYDNISSEIQPVPWVVLADGNGTSAKGFKCEWASVKDGHLWVGGLGKDWTTPEGEFVNYNPQFVKKISPTGEVTHLSWRMNYQKVASEMGIHFPGYVVHESAGWSETLKKWMLLPRRASQDKYNDKVDERKGTNMMVLADEDFSSIKVSTVGEIIPTHGFSSFKWIPGTKDKLVVALKSEEIEGKTATFIMVFDMEGNIILPETKVGDHKYEGIEFL